MVRLAAGKEKKRLNRGGSLISGRRKAPDHTSQGVAEEANGERAGWLRTDSLSLDSAFVHHSFDAGPSCLCFLTRPSTWLLPQCLVLFAAVPW